MKIGIEELKKKIVELLDSGKCSDASFFGLFKDLKLELEDINLLEFCLDQLVKEKILFRSFSFDHFEYDILKKLGGVRI